MTHLLRFVALGTITLAVGCGGSVTSDDAPASMPSDADAATSDDSSTTLANDDAAPEATRTSHVGDPCTSAATCPSGGSGTAVCLTDWPGGYCAVASCAQHGHDCPQDPGSGGTSTVGGKCVLDPDATCLALCAGDTDCRDGYTCQSRSDAAGHGQVRVCVPAASASAGGSMGDADGGMGGMMSDGGMGGGM